MNNKRKYTPGEILISVVFLIWFFGSMVLMIFFKMIDVPELIIGVFGQYFLVFGILSLWSGIKNKNYNPIFFIIPIVGVTGIAVSLTMLFGTKATIDFIEENWGYAILVIFIIVGLLLEVSAFYMTVGKKSRCTESVVAICVDILVNYDDEGYEIYCPVYEANVGGITNQFCNNIYSSDNHVQVGDLKDIYISEYEPGVCYESSSNGKMGLITAVLGLFFIAMPLFGFFMIWLDK